MSNAKVVFEDAPEKIGGDPIELSALVGKTIAFFGKAREQRKTKFGDRAMTQALIFCEGEKEPLEGIMFQTYFSNLPLEKWFVGKVIEVPAGNRMKAWALDASAVDKKISAALAKSIEAYMTATAAA